MEIKVTNKIYLIACILALSIGSNVLSQGRGAPPASIDTNGNGTVEKSEFSAMHDQRFATMDLDANGISFDEFKAKEMADKSRANTRAIQRNFNSYDIDSNGTISATEYTVAGSKRFDSMSQKNNRMKSNKRGRSKGSARNKGGDRNNGSMYNNRAMRNNGGMGNRGRNR